MNSLDNVVEQIFNEESPYTLDKSNKSSLFNRVLLDLSKYHYEHCQEYRHIIDAYNINLIELEKSSSIPALAVRLFKEYELKSIDSSDVVKTLTSSGTTSQKVSKIYLDNYTSTLQTKTLVHIMQYFLGKKRVPMLIIDHPGVIKNRASFSARGAGILGLSNFGRNHTYALNDEMEINLDAIEKFIEKHQDMPIFIFGFTFMVWQFFIEPMLKNNKTLNLKNCILIHSGGWKKLEDKAVDNETFKLAFEKVTGSKRVHNFYGMVEQVGSIYVECEEGYLHASNFSDIEIINPIDFSLCENNQQGIIQVTSLLPKSYPGHKLLTEDLGVILGEDNCKCGKKGKYFKVIGRIPKAEVRGCSDTFEKQK